MIDPAQLLAIAKMLNPLALPGWLYRRLFRREPLPPTTCRNCGIAGEMELYSSAVEEGGHVVEMWKCRRCGSPRHVVFPKPLGFAVAGASIAESRQA
jgi:hypothetical protein